MELFGKIKIIKNLERRFEERPDMAETVIKHILSLIEFYQETTMQSNGASAAASINKYLIGRVGEDTVKATCSKGCAFCCYINRIITEDEGQLLFYAIENGAYFDRELAKKQKGYDIDNWSELAYKDRKCPFLTPENTCGVYEYRPSVCASYRVASDPKICNTEFDYYAQTLEISSLHTEIILSAIANVSPVLPMSDMLYKIDTELEILI